VKELGGYTTIVSQVKGRDSEGRVRSMVRVAGSRFLLILILEEPSRAGAVPVEVPSFARDQYGGALASSKRSFHAQDAAILQ
jgi:hypothetical protein